MRNNLRQEVHTSLLKMQPRRMCSIVSEAWSQTTHASVG
jgi:hypothetical protein